KPGDRIQLAGCYKAIGKPNQATTSATFKKIVTQEDIKNIKKVSKTKDVFELLARSLAPSIYGHEIIKKAILLMLLGGKEQNLSSGLPFSSSVGYPDAVGK
ncbi:4227_t:CDS:2, partial [Racocetra fulgida]